MDIRKLQKITLNALEAVKARDAQAVSIELAEKRRHTLTEQNERRAQIDAAIVAFRERVNAVAMIVSDPPSSMLRAAPKKRFGFCSAFESRPPERILPDDGATVL